MLKLSKKTDYAIILLTHLAVKTIPVSAQEIAFQYHLPQPMVANILKLLASSGIIESKRGQQGGYILVKSPGTVSIAEIIRVTDHTLNLVECVHADDSCKVNQWCPTKDTLIALNHRVEQFMESLTLEEIISHPRFNII
ncbi:MAG: Rrf2 family transcriptional regulator [SAR324 cluster bacterium]|nr:Rrf2 family transcriptional regulator [SAR324 cluster bacterium]